MKLKKQHEEVLRKALNQKAINEALVQLIAVRNLPYNCMTWPELHALLMIVNYMVEDVLRSSAAEVPKLMKSSYMTHKNILRKKLQSAISKIHLTADVWTSPNCKSFLGICAHFVDDETKRLCQAILALPEVEEGHGGEQQAGVLLPVLEDYGIVDKIGYVTGDNHGSNDKLCHFISKHLSDQGINWSPVHHRIRCHGHVVNLAIQAFLFSKDHDAIDVTCQQVEAKDGVEKDIQLLEQWKKAKSYGWRQMGPLGKVHNTAVHIRIDNIRWNAFKTRAGRILSLDNDTRWNSWFSLLEVTLLKREHVEWYQKKYYSDLKDDFLTPEDWETLEETRSFLQPFYRVTLETQGHCAMLDRMLYTMDILIKHFKKAAVGL